MARFIRMRNWERLQHYKHRRPPWIRLYTELIDAECRDYWRLQDASKLQLIHLWLLASRHDNKLPYDLEWLQARLNLKSKLDLAPLVSAGLIEIYDDASATLAGRTQDATPETDTETEETERESRPLASVAKENPSPQQSVVRSVEEVISYVGAAIVEPSKIAGWIKQFGVELICETLNDIHHKKPGSLRGKGSGYLFKCVEARHLNPKMRPLASRPISKMPGWSN